VFTLDSVSVRLFLGLLGFAFCHVVMAILRGKISRHFDEISNGEDPMTGVPLIFRTRSSLGKKDRLYLKKGGSLGLVTAYWLLVLLSLPFGLLMMYSLQSMLRK
jgi:hypothetical protein